MPGEHCPCPYKIHSVALSPAPLPLATDDHVLLLLPELPLCWDALGWALLPKFACDRGCIHCPLTVAFPILLPGEGSARGALADPHLLPSLLSLSRFPGPGSADSATLGVSEPRTNRPDHLLWA